ncbi:DEAD/DEAH box helicase [Salininema proteolyticum]|uniref:DEAD/DEAH box helicase n=1 Tax=Salininema proteolyticum TaxID=1607685 RepID=A0ABV8U448_9ACTN
MHSTQYEQWTADSDVAFLPADPPRGSQVALYRRTSKSNIPSDPVERIKTVGENGRTRTVSAVLLYPERAAETLLTTEFRTESGKAWALAARKALEMIAKGRLIPGLDGVDGDSWRLGPWGSEDLQYLRRLAAAMPFAAYAIPMAVTPIRLAEPYPLLRAFCDSVADAWPRTPAAGLYTGNEIFTGENPQVIEDSDVRWLQRLAGETDYGLGLGLAVDIDDKGTGVVRLCAFDREDPDRPVPDADVARLAESRADRLRRLSWASGWPPLQSLPRSATSRKLRHEDFAALLDHAWEYLEDNGLPVFWPDRLDRAALDISAELGTRDDTEAPSLFSLEGALDFNWRAACGDKTLTPADIRKLTRAAGPVVKLADRWVVISDEHKQRLRDEPRSLSPVEGLRAALSGVLHVGGHDQPIEATGALKRLTERLTAPVPRDFRPQPAALSGALRDYQLRGYNWMDELTELGFGACLADDMGLGKTIQLIALHLHRQNDGATAGPSLIICPTSLLANWSAEIAKFAPGTPVRRYHGPDRDLENLDKNEFVLTTYATMRIDAEALANAEWGMVGADEAQHVKNPASATAKALRSLNAPAKIALTGTPVENNLTDLWAILDWLTPGLLGSLESFRKTYARAAETGDQERAGQLASLVRPFLMRRLKTDPSIAPELPEKVESDQRVSLSKEQIGLYRRVVSDTMDEIAASAGIARRGLVLKLLTRLKQICNHPAQFTKSTDPADGKSGKLDVLDELLSEITVAGDQTLVFTQYTQMGHLLKRHLAGHDAEFLHGGTSVKKRQELVSRFQAGEIPVLILSVKAAGVGLNLTAATHVVHYDRWWNPAVEDQATDRAYRIGQDNRVQVHKFICEGTLEEKIDRLLHKKKALAEAVVGSGEAALTEMTDDQLYELVKLEST